jgi:hypothetical protein
MRTHIGAGYKAEDEHIVFAGIRKAEDNIDAPVCVPPSMSACRLLLHQGGTLISLQIYEHKNMNRLVLKFENKDYIQHSDSPNSLALSSPRQSVQSLCVSLETKFGQSNSKQMISSNRSDSIPFPQQRLPHGYLHI